MRYDSSRQKTVKMDIDTLNYINIKCAVEKICTWLKGKAFEMDYHLSHTSLKQYKLIVGDNEVLEMVSMAGAMAKGEVVVSTKELEGLKPLSSWIYSKLCAVELVDNWRGLRTVDEDGKLRIGEGGAQLMETGNRESARVARS
ncbi:hypothetical protein AXF42_Ash010528 [Apostasia shenzhenica]|uniref:Uncharacterized protein n=1 Tax=Apostasia shenzhenica TaxID=1088818 RepID=A0A2I0A6C0_9ASPA|nr:hypothetical protein AXF42_Ash010528 [Apostasia shenzhenica]